MTDSHQVTDVSCELVKCADPSAVTGLSRPFRLGALDYVLGTAYIPIGVVFVYPASDPGEPTVHEDRLGRALSLLLDHYPHLTGRLRQDETGHREVVDLGSGVGFHLATCPQDLGAGSNSIRRIGMDDLPGRGNDLFAPFVASMDFVTTQPLLTVKHTRFACGSSAVAVRSLHTICDAAGLVQLCQDLASIYRVLEDDGKGSRASLSSPPIIQPYMSEPLEQTKIKSALSHRPALFHADQKANPVNVAADHTTPVSPVIGRVIRFSSTDLEVIKSAASVGLSKEWVSTFDALCAHLHCRVYIARHRLFTSQLRTLSAPDLLCPVNLRSRLPALGSRYFPQALFTPFASFDPQDLLAGDLSKVASSVHRMLRTPCVDSPCDVQATLDWISAQPDKTRVQCGFRYGSGSLMLSQWNKFDMYEACALGVAPAAVFKPFDEVSLLDGLGYFLPSPERGDGGLDLCLALSEPVWEILLEDRVLGGTDRTRS